MTHQARLTRRLVTVEPVVVPATWSGAPAAPLTCAPHQSRPAVPPGRFLGEYQGLVGQPTDFAALFAQAQPQARIGPTDGFFSRVRLVGKAG